MTTPAVQHYAEGFDLTALRRDARRSIEITGRRQVIHKHTHTSCPGQGQVGPGDGCEIYSSLEDFT